MKTYRTLACIALAASMVLEVGCSEPSQAPAGPTVAEASSPPPKPAGKGKRPPKVLTNLQNNNTGLTE